MLIWYAKILSHSQFCLTIHFYADQGLELGDEEENHPYRGISGRAEDGLVNTIRIIGGEYPFQYFHFDFLFRTYLSLLILFDQHFHGI